LCVATQFVVINEYKRILVYKFNQSRLFLTYTNHMFATIFRLHVSFLVRFLPLG
ncbi:hypothetical protein ACJX0J_035918, partial [Zea mays]